MKITDKLYVDTVANEPLLYIHEETLSDGSKVYNLKFKGFDPIPCISRRHAENAFMAITVSLKKSTNDNVVIF